MASRKTNKPSTRRSNRKARTEVSSSSDSSSSPSDSEAESPPPSHRAQQHPITEAKPSVQKKNDKHAPPSTGSSSAPAPPTPSPSPSKQQPSLDQFYLSQATREFANDLEKLRNAGDFRGERSVEVLVRGLRQGVVCFGEEGRGRVAEGG